MRIDNVKNIKDLSRLKKILPFKYLPLSNGKILLQN